VEAALMAEVSDGVPLVEALLQRLPELAPLLSRELERDKVAEVHLVRAVLELLPQIPPGMCERLMAIPIRRDPDSGRVDVAAVDALDSHVAAEFSFHLGAQVRILRARRSELRAALVAMRFHTPDAAPALRSSPQPASAARAESSTRKSQPAPRMPSDAPIPLLRRPSLSQRSAEVAAEEPVLSLSRSKFVPPAFVFERALDESLSRIASAESAEQVGRLLCEALEPADVILVSVRASGFDARGVSRSLFGGDALNLSLAAGKNSVFDAALRAGFYLGPLSPGLTHSELRALLPNEARAEVYAAPVVLAGRPVLVLLMARFGPSLDATQRADKLLKAAGSALERVLLAKKRGG
jgi:hypothetical protein